MREPLQAALVEAFAEAPLGGNGAGVVLLQEPAEPVWMQAVAARLQQSETAFLWIGADGEWRLRWFTPSCEVPLCGHATLASLLALGHWNLLQPGESLELWTRSGPLTVSLDDRAERSGSVVLPCGEMQTAPAPDALQVLLSERLGSGPTSFWTSSLGSISFCCLLMWKTLMYKWSRKGYLSMVQ